MLLDLIDLVIGTLVVGGIYALIAIGLNLQYGVARVLNLAYGELLMLGGYAAFFGFTQLGLPPLAVAVLGVPVAFGLGWLLFRFILHPLLGRTADAGKREVDSILSTFGLLFLLQGIALVAWTGNDRDYGYLVGEKLTILGTAIQYNRLIVVIAAVVLSAGTFAYLRYSTPGRAMRAIASSPHTAPLVGIDVRQYSAVAFATGAALAAVAGILLSSFRGVNPTMGAAYTLNALIVIVMGGIGNVAGGLVAALLLGFTQTLADQLGQSALGTVIVFAVFAAVLLWRPQGLFGAGPWWSSAGVRRRGYRHSKEAMAVIGLGALLLLPLVADVYWLLLSINILTYVALATAWAFFSGPTRYVSLAASAFFGLGAYCVAVLATAYTYPAALLAAVVFAVVLSAVVGLATLRLSGMYFVIFTFGLASLVSAAVTWWEFNIAKSSGWYVYLSISDAAIYYQLLALCVAVVVLWLWRDRSRMGHALRTLGADETVARQIGINTVGLKVGTFVVSAVVMALAGAILAPRTSYVTAHSVFNPEVSFLTVIAALLGGATSVWGPMLGVVPLLLVKDYLSIFYSSHFSVLLGLILLGVVFFLPNGIVGLVQALRVRLHAGGVGGLLQSGRAAVTAATLADVLEAMARRLRAVGLNAAALPPPPSQPPQINDLRRGELEKAPAETPQRKALS
ncbi:MAG TPA: ABC transporter permease [Hyphomicrobiaceae bacterium]|nr:ABC transporter permease [Hyphomicrobiaceae bacterium]